MSDEDHTSNGMTYGERQIEAYNDIVLKPTKMSNPTKRGMQPQPIYCMLCKDRLVLLMYWGYKNKGSMRRDNTVRTKSGWVYCRKCDRPTRDPREH